MAILAGLSSSPIFRLARSWALLSQRTNATYAALRKLMDPTKNFANYREVLASTNAFVPCIPFLGVTLTDLTFLEEGNASTTKTGTISFAKHVRTGEVIQELLRRQGVAYHLTPVEEVGHALNVWISDGARLGEGELWNLSLALEPKEREDEKLTRLLHESGLL
jgi:son of sevenless-like protein